MGPSDGWIAALSRSIGTPGISKMFALVLLSLATNQLKLLQVASRLGSERQCDWVLFLLGNSAPASRAVCFCCRA